MAHVVLLTHEAIYRGSLCLTTSGGQLLRFIDVLRAPQRVFPSAMGSSPSLHLTDSTRQCRRTGAVDRPPGPVYLRAISVLAAYDLDPRPRDLSKVVYEQRLPRRSTTRVVLRLRGELRLEGTITGGNRSLDSLYADTFVACTDALLAPPTPLAKTQSLPFLAVNTSEIESICVVDARLRPRIVQPADDDTRVDLPAAVGA